MALVEQRFAGGVLRREVGDAVHEHATGRREVGRGVGVDAVVELALDVEGEVEVVAEDAAEADVDGHGAHVLEAGPARHLVREGGARLGDRRCVLRRQGADEGVRLVALAVGDGGRHAPAGRLEVVDGHTRGERAAVRAQVVDESVVHRLPAAAHVADVVLRKEIALELADDVFRAEVVGRAVVRVDGGERAHEAPDGAGGGVLGRSIGRMSCRRGAQASPTSARASCGRGVPCRSARRALS